MLSSNGALSSWDAIIFDEPFSTQSSVRPRWVRKSSTKFHFQRIRKSRSSLNPLSWNYRDTLIGEEIVMKLDVKTWLTESQKSPPIGNSHTDIIHIPLWPYSSRKFMKSHRLACIIAAKLPYRLFILNSTAVYDVTGFMAKIEGDIYPTSLRKSTWQRIILSLLGSWPHASLGESTIRSIWEIYYCPE